MSLLITAVRPEGVQVIADTRVTSMSGGFQTLSEGKIVKSMLSDGSQEVLIGTVGNADHHSLLKYSLSQRPINSSSWVDIFNFFALFYEEADNKGMRVFGADTDYLSVFHLALPDKAWEVNGLSIEPIVMVSAAGSGSDVAFGALAAGASLSQAAKIVCDHNAYCSFPIDVWEATADKTHFNYQRLNESGESISGAIAPDYLSNGTQGPLTIHE